MLESKLEAFAQGKQMSFPEMSVEELQEILDLTIKNDNQNKVATFLCMLAAFTSDSQFNIAFVAPSSSGKSYIPLEVAKLFPAEDVIDLAYSSPTAFWHQNSNWIPDKDSTKEEPKGKYVADLERKIIIFLDQQSTQVLEKLRPLLSHDKKEVKIQVTDRTKRRNQTKNVILKGFASVLFCTTSGQMDEQENTRFILLSPEIDQDKIRAAVIQRFRKEADPVAYEAELNSNPKRMRLIERIRAIRDEKIQEILVPQKAEIEKAFLERQLILKPRHARDAGRLVSLTKSFTLLNLWGRRTDRDGVLATTWEDFQNALKVWDSISEAQELGLPPYYYDVYKKVFFALWEEIKDQPCGELMKGDICVKKIGDHGLQKQQIAEKYRQVYGKRVSNDYLRKDMIPKWEEAGLVFAEQYEHNRSWWPIKPA